MDIVVQPSLIIGVGGTGSNVLDRIRKRLRQRVGTDRLPGLIEYLYVDTDRQNNQRLQNPNEGVSISMDDVSGHRLTLPEYRHREFKELELDEMIAHGIDQELSRGSLGGARGIRPLGHLSFLVSQDLTTLQAMLGAKLSDLLRADEKAGTRLVGIEPQYLDIDVRAVRSRAIIYVLASAGGGTGSSIFSDVGYFVQRVLIDRGLDEDRFLTVGVACIGSTDAPESGQHRVNSAAAVTELNHYHLGNGYRAAYPVSFRDQPISPQARGRFQGLSKRPPFKRTYIVEPAQRGRGPLFAHDTARSFTALEQKVCEFVVSDLVYANASRSMLAEDGSLRPWAQALKDNVLQARIEDMESYTRGIKYEDTYPCHLMSFGVTTREIPAAMHHTLIFGRAMSALAERWSSEPKREPDSPETDLGNPKASSGLAVWARTLGLHPEEALYDAERPHNIEDDRLVDLLLGRDGGNDPVRDILRSAARISAPGKGEDWDEETLFREASGRISSLVAEVPDSPGMPDRGSVFAFIRDQARRLAGSGTSGWGQSSLPYQVARDLLDLAFDPDAGPGAAGVLAARLEVLVRREGEFLDAALASMPSPQSAARVGPATTQSATNRDWLMLWRADSGDSAPLQSETALRAWLMANNALLRVLLAQKREVLVQVLTALTKMSVRLRYLRDYFAQWRRNVPKAEDYMPDEAERDYVLVDETSLSRSLDSSHFSGALSQLAMKGALLHDVERRLPDEAADGSPSLLAQGVPWDRPNSRPDFSHLAELEKRLFEAIGNAPHNPYQADVIDLVRRNAAARGVALDDLGREASLLVNFEIDPTYRQDCVFRDDVDYWQMLADNQAEGYNLFRDEIDTQRRSQQLPDRPRTPLRETNSHMPSLFALTYHRRGIVTPLIRGYEPETIRRITDGPGVSLSPYVDARIKPLLPSSALNKAREQFLTAAFMGPDLIFQLDDRNFVYRYQFEVHGAPQPRTVQLPMAFPDAVEKLARNTEWSGQIEGRLRKLWADDRASMQARIEEVFKVLSGIIGARRNPLDALPDSVDVWATLQTGSGIFVSGLDAEYAFTLLARFDESFGLGCEFTVEHNHATRLRKGQLIPVHGGEAPNAGYWCKHCGHVLGTRLPSNNDLCEYCHNTGPQASQEGV